MNKAITNRAFIQSIQDIAFHFQPTHIRANPRRRRKKMANETLKRNCVFFVLPIQPSIQVYNAHVCVYVYLLICHSPSTVPFHVAVCSILHRHFISLFLISFLFFNVICNIFTCLQFLWCFCFHKDFSYPTPFHLVNEFYSQSIKCIEYSLKYTFAMYVNNHLIIIILNKLGTHTRYAAKYQPNHKP